MSHVAWSVCLSVLVTLMSCAEMAEPTEMPFGGGATLLGQMNTELDGGRHQMNPFAAARGDMSAMRPFAKLL